MLTILDLGEDILSSELCKSMSAIDIFNLSLTCKSMYNHLSSNNVYHQLYVKKFGQQSPLNVEKYEWKQIFTLRSSKKLNFYTWGSSRNGRLGYSMNSVPSDFKTSRSSGVHFPSIVENFNHCIISQISSGGFSFQVLTGGDVYCVGSNFSNGSGVISSPGPPEGDTSHSSDSIAHLDTLFQDITSMRERTPIRLNLPQRGPDNLNLRRPPENLHFQLDSKPAAKESSFVVKLKIPNKTKNRFIERISSGRSHVLALDNEGSVYTWDTGTRDWTTAVRLIIPLEGRIIDISAGWNISACLSSSVGIIFWSSRDNASFDENHDVTAEANVDYKIIPRSSGTKGFCALNNHIVFIDHNGLLRCHNVDPSIADRIMLRGFNSWLQNHNAGYGEKSLFTKVVGSYNSFVVFSNKGSVLIGHLNPTGTGFDLEVIPELQNNNFTDVVLGDYHYVALTDSGSLYSWGLESQYSGCLGLGDLSSREESSIVHEGRNSRVLKPTEIIKPKGTGKWLAVTAAGWHSGGLFISQ